MNIYYNADAIKFCVIIVGLLLSPVLIVRTCRYIFVYALLHLSKSLNITEDEEGSLVLRKQVSKRIHMSIIFRPPGIRFCRLTVDHVKVYLTIDHRISLSEAQSPRKTSKHLNTLLTKIISYSELMRIVRRFAIILQLRRVSLKVKFAPSYDSLFGVESFGANPYIRSQKWLRYDMDIQDLQITLSANSEISMKSLTVSGGDNTQIEIDTIKLFGAGCVSDNSQVDVVVSSVILQSSIDDICKLILAYSAVNLAQSIANGTNKQASPPSHKSNLHMKIATALSDILSALGISRNFEDGMLLHVTFEKPVDFQLIHDESKHKYCNTSTGSTTLHGVLTFGSVDVTIIPRSRCSECQIWDLDGVTYVLKTRILKYMVEIVENKYIHTDQIITGENCLLTYKQIDQRYYITAKQHDDLMITATSAWEYDWYIWYLILMKPYRIHKYYRKPPTVRHQQAVATAAKSNCVNLDESRGIHKNSAFHTYDHFKALTGVHKHWAAFMKSNNYIMDLEFTSVHLYLDTDMDFDAHDTCPMPYPHAFSAVNGYMKEKSLGEAILSGNHSLQALLDLKKFDHLYFKNILVNNSSSIQKSIVVIGSLQFFRHDMFGSPLLLEESSIKNSNDCSTPVISRRGSQASNLSEGNSSRKSYACEAICAFIDISTICFVGSSDGSAMQFKAMNVVIDENLYIDNKRTLSGSEKALEIQQYLGHVLNILQHIVAKGTYFRSNTILEQNYHIASVPTFYNIDFQLEHCLYRIANWSLETFRVRIYKDSCFNSTITNIDSVSMVNTRSQRSVIDARRILIKSYIIKQINSKDQEVQWDDWDSIRTVNLNSVPFETSNPKFKTAAKSYGNADDPPNKDLHDIQFRGLGISLHEIVIILNNSHDQIDALSAPIQTYSETISHMTCSRRRIVKLYQLGSTRGRPCVVCMKGITVGLSIVDIYLAAKPVQPHEHLVKVGTRTAECSPLRTRNANPTLTNADPSAYYCSRFVRNSTMVSKGSPNRKLDTLGEAATPNRGLNDKLHRQHTTTDFYESGAQSSIVARKRQDPHRPRGEFCSNCLGDATCTPSRMFENKNPPTFSGDGGAWRAPHEAWTDTPRWFRPSRSLSNTENKLQQFEIIRHYVECIVHGIFNEATHFRDFLQLQLASSITKTIERLNDSNGCEWVDDLYASLHPVSNLHSQKQDFLLGRTPASCAAEWTSDRFQSITNGAFSYHTFGLRHIDVKANYGLGTSYASTFETVQLSVEALKLLMNKQANSIDIRSTTATYDVRSNDLEVTTKSFACCFKTIPKLESLQEIYTSLETEKSSLRNISSEQYSNSTAMTQALAIKVTLAQIDFQLLTLSLRAQNPLLVDYKSGLSHLTPAMLQVQVPDRLNVYIDAYELVCIYSRIRLCLDGNSLGIDSSDERICLNADPQLLQRLVNLHPKFMNDDVMSFVKLLGSRDKGTKTSNVATQSGIVWSMKIKNIQLRLFEGAHVTVDDVIFKDGGLYLYGIRIGLYIPDNKSLSAFACITKLTLIDRHLVCERVIANTAPAHILHSIGGHGLALIFVRSQVRQLIGLNTEGNENALCSNIGGRSAKMKHHEPEYMYDPVTSISILDLCITAQTKPITLAKFLHNSGISPGPFGHRSSQLGTEGVRALSNPLRFDSDLNGSNGRTFRNLNLIESNDPRVLPNYKQSIFCDADNLLMLYLARVQNPEPDGDVTTKSNSTLSIVSSDFTISILRQPLDRDELAHGNEHCSGPVSLDRNSPEPAQTLVISAKCTFRAVVDGSFILRSDISSLIEINHYRKICTGTVNHIFVAMQQPHAYSLTAIIIHITSMLNAFTAMHNIQSSRLHATLEPGSASELEVTDTAVHIIKCKPFSTILRVGVLRAILLLSDEIPILDLLLEETTLRHKSLDTTRMLVRTTIQNIHVQSGMQYLRKKDTGGLTLLLGRMNIGGVSKRGPVLPSPNLHTSTFLTFDSVYEVSIGERQWSNKIQRKFLNRLLGGRAHQGNGNQARPLFETRSNSIKRTEFYTIRISIVPIHLTINQKFLIHMNRYLIHAKKGNINSTGEIVDLAVTRRNNKLQDPRQHNPAFALPCHLRLDSGHSDPTIYNEVASEDNNLSRPRTCDAHEPTVAQAAYSPPSPHYMTSSPGTLTKDTYLQFATISRVDPAKQHKLQSSPPRKEAKFRLSFSGLTRPSFFPRRAPPTVSATIPIILNVGLLTSEYADLAASFALEPNNPSIPYLPALFDPEYVRYIELSADIDDETESSTSENIARSLLDAEQFLLDKSKKPVFMKIPEETQYIVTVRELSCPSLAIDLSYTGVISLKNSFLDFSTMKLTQMTGSSVMDITKQSLWYLATTSIGKTIRKKFIDVISRKKGSKRHAVKMLTQRTRSWLKEKSYSTVDTRIVDETSRHLQ